MLRTFFRLYPIVFAALAYLVSPQAALGQAAPDCSNEKSLKSTPSSTPSELSFQNRSGEKRRIYWLDQDGDRKFYGVVDPGNQLKQPTMVDHAWIVTDDNEKCLYAVIATAEPRLVEVGEAAGNIAAPPQAAQQVIAPPPAVVQAPPVAQAAPPPPPVAQAAPPPVAAAPAPVAPPAQDPQTAMAEIPQISPVEQFDLRGAFRLGSRLDPSKVLNNDTSGAVFVVAVKPEWDSGQWTFEAVAGTPFVRIRNAWKGTYLADFNGKPRAMPAAPAAPETHWTFEPVDGTEFVQFRNRETDRFLLAINGAAALVDAFGPDQESLSQWRIKPARDAVATAPPPQRPLYDAASASCRQIGGYWTGSSCRRPVYMTERLACPRGFVWAEEVGECIWDEGSCPPWQQAPGGLCGPNLACRGGAVAPGPRGYPACYCPAGQVAWGNYPNLSCVPSIVRVAPLLIPAVVAGTAIAIIGSNQGRPQIGQVYGNNKFCPQGTTGTPPNCVTAQTCQPPLVGTPPNCVRPIVRVNACPAGQIRGSNDACVAITCAGGTVNQNTCTCPVGTTRQGGGANFQCVAATTPPGPPIGGGGGGTTQNPVITCAGGSLNQGVCTCPTGTSRQGGGTNFQCVAVPPVAGGGGTTPDPICNLGERLVDHKCVKLNDAITCVGGKIEQGSCGCPQGTRLTGSGNNFQCVAATTQNCNGGQTLQNGVCVAITCQGGNMIGNTGNCRCNNPTDEIQRPSATTIVCMAKIGNAVTTTIDPATGIQTTKTTSQTGTVTTTTACASGFTGTPPNCKSTAGGKPVTATCGENRVGTPPNCQCAPGRSGPNCAPDAPCDPRTQTGTPGKCVDKVIPCEGGIVDKSSGTCVCGSGKGAVNGVCVAKTCSGGQMVGDQCRCSNPNQTAQRTSFTTFVCTGSGAGACPPDSTGNPPSCTCKTGTTGQPGNCKPVGTGTPAGGGAVAPAACPNGTTGTPPNCVPDPKVNRQPAKCPDGMTGTPPNCVTPAPAKCPDGMTGTPPNCARAAPAKCPDGTTGTPPNCKANPPPTCPAGTTGTPPNCRANPPPTCPAGTTGMPPNCRANPPPTCPAGTTGTPPNCRANPPPTCPAGTTGTPPNCRANPPPSCPAGTTGIPPNCRPAQTAPQPQIKPPTGNAPACAPPKRLLPNGQCV